MERLPNPSQARARIIVSSLIVAVPLLIVGSVLMRSKKYVDVFDERKSLPDRVAEAKSRGFIFDSAEFQPKNVDENDNGFVPLKEHFLKLSSSKQRAQLQEFADKVHIFDKSLPRSVADVIGLANKVGARTKFDAHRDYDLGFWLLFPEFERMRTCTTVLVYEAIRKAHYGDDSGAKLALERARNICVQQSNDPTEIGVLVTIAILRIYYEGIAQAIIASPDPRRASQVLDSLWDAAPAQQSVGTMLRHELFCLLVLLRNYEQLGGAKALNAMTGDGGLPEIAGKNFVRSGLPTSAVAQGMLSRTIDVMLKLDEITRTEPSPVEMGKKMDVYMDKQKLSLGNLFVSQLNTTYTQMCNAQARPSVSKELAKWAARIWVESGGKPKNVASISDPVLGGKFVFKPYRTGFCVYSTGPNKVDEGGPTNIQSKTGGKSDDLGHVFPFSARAPRQRASRP